MREGVLVFNPVLLGLRLIATPASSCAETQYPSQEAREAFCAAVGLSEKQARLFPVRRLDGCLHAAH